MIFRIVSSLLLLMSLFACTTEESHEKVYSMDDIIEGSNQKVILKDTIIPEAPIDETFLKIATKLAVTKEDIRQLDTLLFVDRYENESNYKYHVSMKNKMFFVAHWNFNSKSAAKNAFVNWLQCYGKSCNTLNLNDSVSVSNEKMAMLLTQKDLFYLSNVKLDEYQLFVKELIADKKLKEIDFSFYQNGKKGIEWFNFEDFNSPTK